jgi:hypothetical protein
MPQAFLAVINSLSKLTIFFSLRLNFCCNSLIFLRSRIFVGLVFFLPELLQAESSLLTDAEAGPPTGSIASKSVLLLRVRLVSWSDGFGVLQLSF